MLIQHLGRPVASLTGLLKRTTVAHRLLALGTAAFALLMLGTPHAAQDPRRWGAIFVQCPGDDNGDAIPDRQVDVDGDGVVDLVRCMHLAAGDGMVTMADGHPQYTFGFSDVTGVLPANVMTAGSLGANFPAPTIRVREGEHFYLNLTNVGMMLRPDLFDAHSVHFHGFPQAASVFDGVPESSTTVHMGSTFTYYYKIIEPGTYMYHCHVEATEHMQMGMLGSLYVEPKQNRTGCAIPAGGSVSPCPVSRLEGGLTGAPLGYAYNDGDGSTAYDVEYPIQIGSFDPNFHDLHLAIQPLPFAAMRDKYPMLNGRGYPDTVDAGVKVTDTDLGPRASQKINSLIEARPGQRILLRLSNLAVTRFYTLGSTIPMKAIGHNARLLRGPTGKDLSYTTNSVTLGGGESVDVIITAPALTGGATSATYVLYTTNLNYLSNNTEDYGGMMTEIRIR